MEEIIYEEWNYSLFKNQIVVEVRKTPRGKDNALEVYKKLKYELFKRKVRVSTIGLFEYIGDNNAGFSFGLSAVDFKNKMGASKASYHRAIEDLKDLNILQETNRFKKDRSGIIAPVFIFRGDLLPNELFDL